MAKRTYRYRANWHRTVEADLNYVPCEDGLRVVNSTLPGNGFSWGYGITVPEEIDGIPVTELDITWKGPLDYIDGPSLKRVTVRLFPNSSFFDHRGPEVSFGTFYTSPIESLHISSTGPLRIGIDSESLKKLWVEAPDIRFQEDGFRKCPNLESVSFLGTVNDDPDWEWGSFSNDIFRGCEHLTAVHGVFKGGYSGSHSFANCRALSVAPSMNVRTLGSCFFYNCESLHSIHLSNGMCRIDGSAFENCLSLEDLYIPDTVTQLGHYAFKNCRSLRSVHLPNGLTEIQDYTFYGCHALKKVFLSDNLTRIGEGAFADCPSLQDPWIPKNLRSIGTRAFYGCRFTKPILIPPSVVELGNQAFGSSSDLCIRGVPGTEAEAFAKREGIRFLPAQR